MPYDKRKAYEKEVTQRTALQKDVRELPRRMALKRREAWYASAEIREIMGNHD
ncbi:hypothetical protein [Pontiella sulfatireligans]|uniref:hypothetical protein n=1 Tax=Pontiella sulfatireligans TaxID=2750658 RepID=UPI001443B660|nr:hypothetical protein [Pontiella sulfatireligans]